jgi:hypothetical protein
MGFYNLQREIDLTTSSIIQIPPGESLIGRVEVHRPVKIVSPCVSGATLQGSLHVTTRGQVVIEGVRFSGDGSNPHGIQCEYAFRTIIRDCLLERYKVPIYINAGNAWCVENNYILGQDFGIVARNTENADEGDPRIVGNTFDSQTGVAAIHYISGGGMRVLDNKILSHYYGILCEFEGVTSDLLITGNSIENQQGVAIAMRVQSGSFENVIINSNQFAGNMYGITVHGVSRGVVQGNVYNLTKTFFQSQRAYDWIVASNSPN